MPDFHRISKRFQKGAANLEDVVRVYQAILLLPGLITTLESGGQANEIWPALLRETYIEKFKVRHRFSFPFLRASLNEAAIQVFEKNVAPLEQMVETTIDLEELDRHNYVIKPEFDEGLVELKTRLEAVRDGLDGEHRTVARNLDMETDNKILHFEQNPLYGYCFRLTRKVCFFPSSGGPN